MICMEDGSNSHQRANPAPGLETFGDDAHWFRELLASKGVHLVEGSDMDATLQAMIWVSNAKLHPPAGPNVEADAARELGTDVGRARLEKVLLVAVAGANLVRTVRKALLVSPTVFDDRWDLFRGPDVLLVKGGKQRRERDLMWELYIAAVAVHAADDVRIGQPDVRCRVRDVSWGIECKVFNSQKTSKHVERVKEAVRQLENSDVDCGFIALNLTNVVDQGRMREGIRAFGKKLFSQDAVLLDLDSQVRAIAAPFVEKQFLLWMSPYSKTRAIFWHANTICLVGLSLSLCTYRLWVDFGSLNPSDEAMSNRFQSAAEKL